VEEDNLLRLGTTLAFGEGGRGGLECLDEDFLTSDIPPGLLVFQHINGNGLRNRTLKNSQMPQPKMTFLMKRVLTQW